MSGGVLAEILAHKEAEVWRMKATPSYVRVATEGKPPDVISKLRRAPGRPLRLIAEVKHRSPSAGALSMALSAGERVVRYANAGASMVSVLADERFFGGGWHDVTDARSALDRAHLPVPVLAKEFVLDERQIAEAAACGAAAVLLIARILPPDRLRKLVSVACTLGIEPLVEIVTEDELVSALATKATLLGVNARDLDTLVVDTARAARVLAGIPPEKVAIHLSGLRTPADVAAIARTRADAALIGEALMREDDPTALLRSFVKAAAT